MPPFQTRFININMYIIRISALTSLGLTILCHASPLRLGLVHPVKAAVSKMETRAVGTAKDDLLLPKVRARDNGPDDTELVGLKFKSRDKAADLSTETHDDEEKDDLIGLKIKI